MSGEMSKAILQMLIPFSVAFVISLAGTPLVRRWALRRGHIDKPKGDRWHSVPTALLGGISIFLAFLVTSLIFARDYPYYVGLAFGGGFIFVFGLLDDLVHFKPYTKLIVQIIGACILIIFGIIAGFSEHIFLTIP